MIESRESGRNGKKTSTGPTHTLETIEAAAYEFILSSVVFLALPQTRHVLGPSRTLDSRPVLFGATIKKNISVACNHIGFHPAAEPSAVIVLHGCWKLARGHGAGRGQFTSPRCNIIHFLNFM